VVKKRELPAHAMPKTLNPKGPRIKCVKKLKTFYKKKSFRFRKKVGCIEAGVLNLHRGQGFISNRNSEKTLCRKVESGK